MNGYLNLSISFWYKDTEYKLYNESVNDYNDSIEIITSFRHPDIQRGCIGNLVLNSIQGTTVPNCEDAPDQTDCYKNVLLSKIQVESADRDSCVRWKYIFMKE